MYEIWENVLNITLYIIKKHITNVILNISHVKCYTVFVTICLLVMYVGRKIGDWNLYSPGKMQISFHSCWTLKNSHWSMVTTWPPSICLNIQSLTRNWVNIRDKNKNKKPTNPTVFYQEHISRDNIIFVYIDFAEYFCKKQVLYREKLTSKRCIFDKFILIKNTVYFVK